MRILAVVGVVFLWAGCQKEESKVDAAAAAAPGEPAPPVAAAEASPPANPTDGWMEFASEDGKYKVRFPAAPDTETVDVPTLIGSIKQTTHSAGLGEAHFGVAFGDYPPEAMKDFDPQKGLDGARDGAINNIGGTLLAEQQITFAGQPARAFQGKATIQGIELHLDARIFMLDNRLYQLIVVNPTSNQAVPADAFFGSFELVDG